jgi:hypothetical protein
MAPNSNNRASTPPRKPVDPGSAIDSNFVNDNWDESPEKVNHRKESNVRILINIYLLNYFYLILFIICRYQLYMV